MAGETRRPHAWEAHEVQTLLRTYCGVEVSRGTAREVATLIQVANNPGPRRLLVRLAEGPLLRRSITGLRWMLKARGKINNRTWHNWLRELELAEFIRITKHTAQLFDIEAVNVGPMAEAAE